MQKELIICNATDLLRISANEVMAFLAGGNYSTVLLTDGEERVVSYQLGILQKIVEQQLSEADVQMFVRIGRSLAINLEYLYSINLPNQCLELKSPLGYKRKFTVPKEPLGKLKDYVEHNLKKGGYNEHDNNG